MTVDVKSLVTDNLDLWSSTIKKRNATGRGSSKKAELYGIKKLRELILELAVRGLLVPQDPSDEPASVLLEKISAEKLRLVKEKKIKKQKPLSPVEEGEKPFNLPLGWISIRLGILFNSIESGGTPSKRNIDYWGGDIPWASVKDLGTKRYIDSTQDYITEIGLKDGSKLASKGDLLICTRMGLGKIAIVQKPMAFNQDLKGVCLSSNTSIEFFINTYATLKIKGTGTTVSGIKQEQLLEYVIGLPPLAEQHRIVTKVNELMTLCDQLEQQQENSISTHQVLVETLLNALTKVDNGQDTNAETTNPANTKQNRFQQAWALIADNFDHLFTTEHSIEQLKQTILQLAVMGKLVPQDPNDEPASVLLEKIAAEKAQLIKDKKIKKQKPLPPISDEERPFELPDGWEWTKVGEVSLLKGGFAYKSKEFVVKSEYQVVRMGNIRPDFLRIDENPVYIAGQNANETKEYEILEHDILLTMTGTKGKRDYLYSLIVNATHLEGKELFLNQRLCAVRSILINSKYMNLVMKEERILDLIYAKSTGTANQANIGMEAISNWLVPIPPAQEQHRIVTKVNELMILCDTLLGRIKAAQTTQLNLTDAIAEQVFAK